MRKNANSYQLITDGYMAADITSDSTNILFQDSVSVVYDWLGTSPDGYLSIEVQNGNSEWITFDPTNNKYHITTNSGVGYFSIVNLPFERFRLFYDRTSGEGELNAYIVTKQS